jgi:hypothetical protein
MKEERKSERTKERKNERTKERKNKRTKERKNERKKERTKEQKNERKKEGKRKRKKERKIERKKIMKESFIVHVYHRFFVYQFLHRQHNNKINKFDPLARCYRREIERKKIGAKLFPGSGTVFIFFSQQARVFHNIIS